MSGFARAAILIKAERHRVFEKLQHERLGVESSRMAQRRVNGMAFAHAMPPDQRMVGAHGGRSRSVTLLIHRRHDMKARLRTWVFRKGVPFLRAMPNLRQPL